MPSTYDYALLVFIAECMCISGVTTDKATAIRMMADRANAVFKGTTRTRKRVAEVKSIITQVA